MRDEEGEVVGDDFEVEERSGDGIACLAVSLSLASACTRASGRLYTPEARSRERYDLDKAHIRTLDTRMMVASTPCPLASPFLASVFDSFWKSPLSMLISSPTPPCPLPTGSGA